MTDDGLIRDAPRAPRCVLMTAQPGAGKTRLALALAERGLTRLCPDEEMFRRHGRRGIDFPRSEYLVRERPILDDLAAELRELLTAGKDVIFDHGLWTEEERDRWRALVIAAGGVPLLVYLSVPHEERWARIQKRNRWQHTDPSEFDEADLIRYATRFHPPGANEPHIIYDGRPETLLAALQPPT